MLTQYIQAAMRHATYEILSNGTFYGEIPGLQGVWANEGALEACREELQSVLEDWIIYRLANNLAIPAVDGVELHVTRAA
ncbi:MAG: type II toxin-antitoxin system HicB family antitoxin [Chloroflexota bacterium]|nr:MAG: type II toxin-antitoxin system HicB family antitoxin [Chloroflexota bacterium]